MEYKVGDIRNGTEVLPFNQRKTILLLADDLRMHSGIATMSREFVMGSVHRYNWIQLAAAVKHAEEGKFIDLSKDTQQKTGVKDASVKIIPSTGYGNAEKLRQIISMEHPDAILHFTDPRYWVWLYDIEYEIRQEMPILYYNIWDSVPDPTFNADYYASCDGLFAISKQTYGLNHRVLSNKYDEELEFVGI